MRFKQKLDEEKLTNNKTDETLLRGATRPVYEKMRRVIDNYMHQIELPMDSNKQWEKEKKRLAFRTIINNLSKMEKDIY